MSLSSPSCFPSPIISWVQKIALYETKARYFIVGSNNTQTRFRVLKIDRTEVKDLTVIDDKVEYSHGEIKEMLMRIDIGNRNKLSKSASSGLNRTISAFGLLGFIQFLEGHYLILITKRRRVAQIGHHAIYKIEDISMTYIPNEIDKSNHEEAKYVKMFQNIDLSSNFYFSYSYDLSHSLQYNLAPFHECYGDNQLVNHHIRTFPNFKFVWNQHLLKSVDLHPDWVVHITHGFVSQTNISIFGRPLYLTLIARRSQKYAGTRFLKRGANCEGDVANEVETEQIVHDASISSFKEGHFTSFVQLRGSIPSHWSQDISKMVPKPTISIDVVDPYCQAASQHFNQLFYRYGSPLFVLNLVKRREQKPHESVLSDEIIETIAYLNQFLPPKHHINYIGFDMARVNKLKDESVMSRLSQIAYSTIKANGIFQSKPLCLTQKDKRLSGGFRCSSGRILQTGIVRVNCVDCLDRTNTAQFALGKVALAFQLFSLGVLSKPELEYETDAVRMLEELYEDHGDTLALQYGGSQLVHRIKTYRKIAPLSSHSRDIMQTLSRYYSNTFSDAEKQNSHNLFLGVYQASKSFPIWDLYSDFYLHHSLASGKVMYDLCSGQRYTQWWDDYVKQALPLPAEEVVKGSDESLMSVIKEKGPDERTDGFYEQYKPYELTVFADTLAFNVLHTCKDFMPNFTADYSPFSVRIRPGKRRETLMGSASKLPNPSVSGHVSTSSTSSSASEIESETEEEDNGNSENMNFVCVNNSANDEPTEESCSYQNSPVRTFETVLTNFEKRYGTLFTTPKRKDLALYEKYVNIGLNSGEIKNKTDQMNNLIITPIIVKMTSSTFTTSNYHDSSISITPPKVSKESMQIYKDYIKRGTHGASMPNRKSLKIYKNYLTEHERIK